MHNIVKFLSLNICCYLCSIVYKILAHVNLNYFSFNFIQIKKNIPTFPEIML